MTAFLADGFARYDVVHCGAYIYYPVDGTCVDGAQAFSVDDALEYKKDDVRYRRLSAAAFMVADFLVCLLKLFAVSGVVCGIWVFCLYGTEHLTAFEFLSFVAMATGDAGCAAIVPGPIFSPWRISRISEFSRYG